MILIIMIEYEIFSFNFISGASIVGLSGDHHDSFLDTDARTRSKRNVTSYDDVGEETNVTTDVIFTHTELPEWKKNLINQKYYGSKQYMERKLYKSNPSRG